jgi:hypothetical protein
MKSFVARGQVFKDIESRKMLSDTDFFRLQMLYSTTLSASLGLVDMYFFHFSILLKTSGDYVSHSGGKSIWLCPEVGARYILFMAACLYPMVSITRTSFESKADLCTPKYLQNSDRCDSQFVSSTIAHAIPSARA